MVETGAAAAPAGGGGSDAQSALDGLHKADHTLALVQQHLLEIDEIWRRVECGEEVRNDDRLSPSTGECGAMTARGAQLLIDRHLASIAHITHDAQSDGVLLFDGRWRLSIEYGAPADAQSFSLPRLTNDLLGNEKIAGVISALRSGEEFAVDSNESAAARSIVRCALFQTSGIRERISMFLQGAVEPSAAAMEIAQENAEAANESMDDAEFVRQLGSITRMDALLAAQSFGSTGINEKNSSPARLRISPDQQEI